MVDPVAVLNDVHQRLRRSDVGEDLLTLVKTYGDAWRRLEPLDLKLKGAYVEAEVFDHLGHYDEAGETLKTFGKQQHDELVRRIRAETTRDEDPAVAKRRIWLVRAYASMLYRMEDYPQALRVLQNCRTAIEVLASAEYPLYGTRARLAYSLGQVFRQLCDYAAARSEFEAAVVFARQRFVAKTPNVELPDYPVSQLKDDERAAFDQDRLLAYSTIGKSLALGLGWIAYTTGQLSAASMLLSAGYSLLRETGDSLHRAYAMLLIGAVERALAGSNPARLDESLRLMKDGAQGLERHPAYSLRACYELALAYYKRPEHRQEARRQIGTLKKGLKGTAQRSARWMSSALLIESRIERLEGNVAHAKRCAQLAVTEAEKAVRQRTEPLQTGDTRHETLAEALIALGEAFLAEAHEADQRGDVSKAAAFREHAIMRFQRALPLGGHNPKMAAVCRLHLARAYSLHGSLLDAHMARSAALALTPSVEHGFVHELAAAVSAEIDRRDCLFLDGRVSTLKKDRHQAALEAFLIRQAKTRGTSPSDWADSIGISETTLKRMESRLLKLGHRVGERRPAGRPRKHRGR